jgi:hypothetical protein
MARKGIFEQSTVPQQFQIKVSTFFPQRCSFKLGDIDLKIDQAIRRKVNLMIYVWLHHR